MTRNLLDGIQIKTCLLLLHYIYFQEWETILNLLIKYRLLELIISLSVLQISREQAQKWDISAIVLEGRNTLLG